MVSPLEQLPNTYRAFFSGFSHLTEAQKQLIQPILNGKDVILQASTGAGKTEAVLAPSTEKLMIHPDHFTIVYIVPTRALALDMHRRVQPIYKKLGLKSGIRTGDGKHLLDANPHLLIMTPESLDVMLGSAHEGNRYFLRHVGIMIIDEVHVFLHDDRGRQLSYLHRRLALQTSGSLQTLALSATIDNPEDIQRFFNLDSCPFYYKQTNARKLQPTWVHIEDEEQELTLFFDDLYHRHRCKKLLVFANSRRKCEQLHDLLNSAGVFAQNAFLHYSNLSTQERKSIEMAFREGKMGVCIATSTLELGIDTGDIDGVVLIGPPPSTMAFLQRIGRGNRRQPYINFWGVCHGEGAGRQLIRFLAFFEMAKGQQVEKCFKRESSSVLFQQILSCLYAKKAVTKEILNLLFKESAQDLSAIFNQMIASNWLKPTKQGYPNHLKNRDLSLATVSGFDLPKNDLYYNTGHFLEVESRELSLKPKTDSSSGLGISLYEGGWRYYWHLKKKQIWSNFPPTEEEYDVILDYEKIAVLPLSMVLQLEIGDIIQLTGKTLRVRQIEEKKAGCEVLVEESHENPSKDLVWMGFGSPLSFEVAQKVGEILLKDGIPEGLLKRTRLLLEAEREKIRHSLEQPNGIRVHQLANGMYRYETFLGTVGNNILSILMKQQLASKIEGLVISADEIGLESNEYIPFDTLKIPHSDKQFHHLIHSQLPLLKRGFAWNSWMRWLPEEQQSKEIASKLYDPRVLSQFQHYHSIREWLPLPDHAVEVEPQQTATQTIALKGEPWTLEKEKAAWGILSFPPIPGEQSATFVISSQETAERKGADVKDRDEGIALAIAEKRCLTDAHLQPAGLSDEIMKVAEQPSSPCCLTAAQLQGYASHKLCPRWARLQHLNYQIDPHPRFSTLIYDMQSRQEKEKSFKREVIEELKTQVMVCFKTPKWSWQEAIRAVILDKKPLFLVNAQLNLGGALSGSPSLIYIQHQESHLCLEVWDIKFSHTISYAQKWRIAFYAYLLEELLKNESFSLPVKISSSGGLVYPSKQGKPFEKSPFLLAPYKTWMPRVIAQWERDARGSVSNYTLESTCTSCRYFSYCYQETLLTVSQEVENQAIVSRNIFSNDFPKNTLHWYFIHYDDERVRWQCWENGVSIKDVCIHSRDFSHEGAFQKAVESDLHKAWMLSVNQDKNPHLLVYESTDWHAFQKAFQSTHLRSLWTMHVSWTSMQNVLETHFIWPMEGRITPAQVGACLGLSKGVMQPLSLYHKDPYSDTLFELCRQIWYWCVSHVKSHRVVSFKGNEGGTTPLVRAYLAIHQRETECHLADVLEFQKNPLTERIQQFRAIGPLKFLGRGYDNDYQFSIEMKSTVSKFRVGDFLKLSPVGSRHIQEGFSVILHTYTPEEQLLSVRPLSKKTNFSKNQLYALDEDATDWNGSKLTKVLKKISKHSPETLQLFLGHTRSFAQDATQWVEQWHQSRALTASLNTLQKQALMLPFRERIGFIEGPPGTGKTHLLVWTLSALVAYAQAKNQPIKILVTAQTHHAIDQILRKVAKTLPAAEVTGVSLWKYGRFDQAQFPRLGIGQMQNTEALYDRSCVILGATGYGIYQLLEHKNFPQLFDWVVFDESSQLLAPYALLGLIFGKGQALFYGDTQQLPPVLKGNYQHTAFPPLSILQELMSKYGPQNRLRLNETYRLNRDICKFASEQWYEEELKSVVSEKDQRLELPHYPKFKDAIDADLDPAQSIVVVHLEHVGAQQSSQEEAKWIVAAVKRLMGEYAIAPEQIGIISPHRLQNQTILSALKEGLPFSVKLPKVETVERMQGLEFDIVIFSATVSDPETVHSRFLKDYRRFNVALTRARKKFIFVASTHFFQSFPKTESELVAQMPFERLLHFPNSLPNSRAVS